jgi:hypothetical protein
LISTGRSGAKPPFLSVSLGRSAEEVSRAAAPKWAGTRASLARCSPRQRRRIAWHSLMPKITIKGAPPIPVNIGGGEYGLGAAIGARVSPFTPEDRREVGCFVREVVGRLGSIPNFSLDSGVKRCVAHLAGAALRRLSALGLLVENDYDSEAGALARTLIDWEVSVARLRFASGEEQADLVGRFNAFEIVQHRRVFLRVGSREANRRLQSVTEMYPDPGRPHENAASLEAAFREAQARYPGIAKWKSWTNAGIPDVIARIGDEAVRGALEQKYREWFAILSEFSHPSSTAAAGGMTSLLGIIAAWPMPHVASECVANMYSMAAALGGVAPPRIEDLLASYSKRLSNKVRIEAKYHAVVTGPLETESDLRRFLVREWIRASFDPEHD